MMDRDELAALDAAATNGPWTGYSEPDVGLPWSLFVGVPGKTGFVPLEPLTGGDVNLIAYLRNHVDEILALIDENARLTGAIKEAIAEADYTPADGDWESGYALGMDTIADGLRDALSPNPD